LKIFINIKNSIFVMEYKSQFSDDKPDWKQWIPIYGIYEVCRAASKGEPTIYKNPEHPLLQFYGTAFYHAVVALGTVTGLAYGVTKIAEKIF